MDREKINLKNEKLARAVLALYKPNLQSHRRKALKEHILLQLDLPMEQSCTLSFESIKRSIRLAVSNLKLEKAAKVNIKEHIFSYIESHSQKRFFIGNIFAFHKKLISLAMVFVLFFGLFGFINIDTNIVRAATFTKLESFEGGVLLEREGEFVDIYPGIEIRERDKIITGEDGQAVIEYFDDSVSRLANDSQIFVNELSGDSFRSRVSISLLGGSGWFKVVNLVESHSSFVVESSDVYASAYRAAFNVHVDTDELEIGVFDNSVDVLSGTERGKVNSGEKIVVDTVSKKVNSVQKLEDEEKDAEWIRDNLENDKLYLTAVDERLLTAKIEAIGIDMNDDFSLEKSLREDVLLFLTFDDVKKGKIELDLAEKDFVAAQVKLHKDNLSEEERLAANEAILSFVNEVDEFYDLVDEVSTTDKLYAAELGQYVEDKIFKQKKDLFVVSPQSPGYEAKKVVNDLELLIADSDMERIGIMSDHVVEKLGFVDGLDEDEVNDALVSEVVEDYKKVLGLVDGLPEENKDLANKIVDNFVFFEASKIIPAKDVSDLKAGVSKISGEEVLPVIIATPVQEVVDTFYPDILSEDFETLDPDSEILTPEPIIQGPFGVEIKGDKPLPPFLQDIQ
ncbi:MAG: FecR family protein [bacterium]|nr:FecR family protein [bacterium]